jgi:hypothetical protein
MAQRHTTCPLRRSSLFTYEYHHVQGRNGTSGSKLEPLINVCCEVTVNFQSRLQERTACQENHVGDVIKEKQKATIKWHISRSWFHASSMIVLNKNQPDAH